MPKPRQVLPGRIYLITRRCAQRQFLLHPDEDTNNAFIYCLGEAAKRFEVDVLMTSAESNHHHTVVFDRHGLVPAFMEHFHKMLARSQNALLGRWENFWAVQEPTVTMLADRETVIAKIVYAVVNPVKDRLVERVHHWPGVNGYVNLMTGRPLRAHRPRHFFREDGPMPETVELYLTIPPELGPAEVREGVEAFERQAAEERKRTGARVIGRRNILAQSWKDTPSSVEPRRNLRPRFAGRIAERIAAMLEYKAFLAAYREARERWLARRPAVFPRGTYWLARFAAVPIADAVQPA